LSIDRTALVPRGHSKPIGKYSPGIAVTLGAGSRLVFVSGQIATAHDGTVLAPGDAAGQAEIVFERISQVLARAGGDLSNLTSLVIYLTDVIGDFAAVSGVRNRVLAAPAPSSTLVEVSRLAEPGCLVEISGTAVLDPGGPA
jgi:2-iminobutanoate/2-iminopropanoate deaminase